MKRILITGSSGDVGKSLISCLSMNEYEVLGLTRRRKSKLESKGDLRDYGSLVDATKGIDIVVHLAGLIKGSKKDLGETNILGTINLIKACKKNKINRIIFISSLDVKFKTDYGVSKLKAEEIIRDSGLRYVILRPSVIYGEGFRKGISKLVHILRKSPIIPVFGSGNNLYQPLYVEDFVLLIKQIIDFNKFNNKIYFVGGPDIISLNQLIDLITFNLNKKIIKIFLPGFLENIFLKTRNFELEKICDNNQIKDDFDFEPIHIKEGVKKLLR